MSQPKREVSYITPDSGRGEMLTSAEYVAKRGMVCPACQSSDINRARRTDGDYTFSSSMILLDDKIMGDNAECWQACKCEDCQYEWEDYYELTGYYPLEDQDE